MVAGSGILYATTDEYISNAYQGTLYLSANSGQSWLRISQLTGPSSSLTVSSQNSQTLYLGEPRYSTGYQISTDGGISWANITTNLYLPQVSVGNVFMSPDGKILYSGIYRSSDGGKTWALTLPSSNTLSKISAWNFNPDNNHIYSFNKYDETQNNGNYTFSYGRLTRSSDNGVTWDDFGPSAYSILQSGYSIRPLSIRLVPDEFV
jgi:photosystem II stability/assembly factor-like uncharacterized protein